VLNGVASCQMVFEQDRPVDFIYLAVNERFHTLTGLKDVAGRRASEVIPGLRESDPELFEICGRVASTGTPERFEGFVVALEMWFLVSVYSPKQGHFVAVFDVTTKRDAADDVLRASEASYRTLFEKSSDGILMADIETKMFRHANPAVARMLGYSESELCTMSIADIHPTESLQHVLAEFEAVSCGEKFLAADIPCLKKDGTIVYADISATPVMMDGRAMSAGFFRDVTERRRGRHALEASEIRYRRLFEAAKDGILILDADSGKIVDVNPFLMALTGYSRADFLGQQLWEFGMFEDLAASKVSFVELQTNAYVRYDDLPLRARDGRKLDVEFVSNAYGVGGRKVIQCNIRDITTRKRVDAERDRLTMAMSQAGEAVYVTDAHGDIVYVNPAFETVTGYSQAEVLGRNPRLLKSGVQDEAFYRTIWETIHADKVWRGRLVNKKKDGTIYTQDGTIAAVRDAAGVITSYVAVARDITQQLQLEAQFLQAQKMEAVGRLAGGVAHDFNNVLSVILSYAEMICADLKPDEPLRADVEEIKQAGWRATALTRQLLAFSRQQVLEPRVLSLAKIVTGLEKMLRRLLGADIELTILAASDAWNVMADAGQIEQVLMNLAVNARDAMPQGGGLTIETTNVELDDDHVRAHNDLPAGAYVQLAVSDTGIGMDLETQARIFEPFFTTKERGKGTGLGLATVFGIVKQSGGHIWLDSEPGKGTTFKICLPNVRGIVEVREPEQSAPESRSSGTILLVEDDDQVRAVAADILRRCGYAVLEAPNGGEALLICEQHQAKIHLLLTDVVLPRMSGRQLAERLAPMRPEMKVLFMSGYTDDVVLQHGIQDSGVAYLQKPLTPTALTGKVRQLLSGGTGASADPADRPGR